MCQRNRFITNNKLYFSSDGIIINVHALKVIVCMPAAKLRRGNRRVPLV
jgi:hypothetical protein